MELRLPRLDHLVPKSDPPTRSRWHPAPIAVGLGVLVIVLGVLMMVRQPGIRSWDSIWAEDGNVFAHDANTMNPFMTLFKGYAGYANLVPRLLSMPTTVLPTTRFASSLALAAVGCNLVIALFIFRMSAGLLRSTWLRLLLMGMTVLAPILYFEANASVANVNWTLLFGAFWAVIATSERRIDVVLRVAVVLLAILSTALAVLYLPLALFVWAGRRARAELSVVVALVGGTIVQLLAAFGTRDTTPTGTTSFTDLPPIFAVRVAGSVLLGERPLTSMWEDHGLTFAIGAVVVLVALLATLSTRADRDARLFGALCVIQALIMFVVPIAVRGSRAMRLDYGEFNPNGSRYIIVPVLVLLSAVLVLADRPRARERSRAQPILVGALVIHGLVVMTTSYSLAGPRSDGPSWDQTVITAREQCRVAPDEDEVLPIAPAPAFFMQLDCDRIAR